MGQLRTVDRREALFDILRDPSFDPGQQALALASEAPAGPIPDTDSTDLGQAVVRRRTATTVSVEVQANEECILVLSDAYYPGWKARIDGREAEVFPVYYVFRAVVVPAGDHTVIFRYSPWSFRVGLALSTLALVSSVFVGMYFLRKSTRWSLNWVSS